MLKKIWQTVILIFFTLFISLFQFSFISALPGIFGQLNLGFFIMIFVLFFFGFKPAVLFLLIYGFSLDFLSFDFFGFYVISFFLSALIAYLILHNWLTNRSLYSFLGLILISTIFYNFFGAILKYILGPESRTFFLIQSNFWISLVYQIIWSLIIAILFFNLAAGLTKKLKPFFLEKKQIV